MASENHSGIRIEDARIPFRKMSVCRGCPALHELMNGAGINMLRCAYDEDEPIDYSISWLFFGVPKKCPRFMEQVVMGQSKAKKWYNEA